MIWDFLAGVWETLRAEAQTLSMVVTALATIALGFFTWVLARETKRLSRATAQAHIVATIEPNQWAINHVDLIVTNTGNAAGHDVVVAFSPEFEKFNGGGKGRPLRHLSVLKPGQSLSSYVGEHSLYRDKTYKVSTSWKHHPSERKRQSLSYELSMGDYESFGHLGAHTPFIEMAQQLKKIREDWQYVANGSRHVKTDSYSREDRDEERKRWEAERRRATGPKRKPGRPDGEDESQ